MSLFYFTHTEPEFQGNIDDKYGYWFTFALFEYFVLYIFAETLLNKCRSFQGEMYVMSVMLLMSVVSFYYEQVRYAPSFRTWCTLGSLLSFAKMKYVVFFWMGSFVKKTLADLPPSLIISISWLLLLFFLQHWQMPLLGTLLGLSNIYFSWFWVPVA